MTPNYRGVAFLLSFGSLPIACNDKDPADTPGTTDTGNDPTPDPSGTTTPVDPTTGPDGTTSTSSTSTGPDPSGTSTESPSTTFLTTVSTTTEDTEDTGPPDFPPIENPQCQAYVDHIVECFPRAAGYAGYYGYYCDQIIKEGMRADGPACVDAIESYLACFSALPCEGLDPENACPTEQAAIDPACPSLGEPDDTSGGTGSDTSTGG